VRRRRHGFAGRIAAATAVDAIAGHIDVQGDSQGAAPSDGGKHWSLCGGTGTPCTSAFSAPGPDQFSERNGHSDGSLAGPQLTVNAQLDSAFSSDASATAGQAVVESLAIGGPYSSSDTSPTFSTTWIWTAVA